MIECIFNIMGLRTSKAYTSVLSLLLTWWCWTKLLTPLSLAALIFTGFVRKSSPQAARGIKWEDAGTAPSKKGLFTMSCGYGYLNCLTGSNSQNMVGEGLHQDCLECLEKQILVLQSNSLKTVGVWGWNLYIHAYGASKHWCLRIMARKRFGKMIMFQALV